MISDERKRGTDQPVPPSCQFKSLRNTISRSIIRNDIDEVLPLVDDRKTPGVESLVAWVKIGFEMLHTGSVNVAGGNAEPHAVTKQRIPVCALVRQVISTAPAL